MSEPLERWGEDAPHGYRAAKSAYAELSPRAEQLERVLARVEAASQPAAAPAWRAAKLWLSVVPLLAVLGAVLFWAAQTPRDQSVPRPRTNPRATTPTPAAAVRGGERPVAAAPAPEAASAAPEPFAERAPAPRPPRRARRADDPLGELALLERARRVLARDPARALELTEEHRRQYQAGQFAEERELLAIEALVELDRSAHAMRRARAFERAHPHSVHLRRLGVILERAAP